MSLDVPVSSCHHVGMDLTEEQRDDLARRMERVRISRYGGSRKAAYSEANVNANTWSSAEAGRPIAERSLIAIVSTLWPDTEGDWRKLVPPLGGERDLVAEVKSWRLPAETEARIIALLEPSPEPPTRAEGSA